KTTANEVRSGAVVTEHHVFVRSAAFRLSSLKPACRRYYERRHHPGIVGKQTLGSDDGGCTAACQMKADESLIIVGSSARAAAFSALRAGLRPWCADLFADVDLLQRCPAVRVPAESYPQCLPDMLDLSPPGQWMYMGG